VIARCKPRSGRVNTVRALVVAALLTVPLSLPPTPAFAQATETLEFARANTCELLRAYVAKYPNGRHISEARTALRSKNCPDPNAEARRARAEAEEALAREEALRRQLAEEREARRRAEEAARKATAPPPAVVTSPISPAPAQSVGTRDLSRFNLNLLDPQVRSAAVAARSAEARGENAAARARSAAQLGENARARALRREAGTLMFDGASGGRYEGDWTNNTANGYGVDTSGGNFSGDRFSGQFQDGKKHGVGVYAYARNANNGNTNSLRYEGEYLNDKTNGVGQFSWTTGDSHAGGQREGKRTGPGVYRFSDGRRYEGEYANDMRNGLGVEWAANGAVLRAGRWENGNLVQSLAR
jgi:hypothetical protein